MTKIPGWERTQVALMLRILTWFKPTTMDEWTASADAQKALYKFFGEDDGKGARASILKPNELVDVLIEKAPAKFLQKCFDAAIAAPEKPGERPPIVGAEAQIAVELEAILKKAAEVPVEEKKAEPAQAKP